MADVTPVYAADVVGNLVEVERLLARSTDTGWPKHVVVRQESEGAPVTLAGLKLIPSAFYFVRYSLVPLEPDPPRDYRCERCGASFSLPLGMTCDDHHPVPVPLEADDDT